MAVTDGSSSVSSRGFGARSIDAGQARTTGTILGQSLPGLAAVAIVLGLLFVVSSTSIVARGDFGQWLMASRSYLGESVPAYRTISAVPPVVPLLLAAVQLVIPDPAIALHVTDGLLLIALGAAFYVAGSWILGDPWVGVFAVVAGLLGTDRFFELFAFGGMLQVAALACMMIGIAAFTRASREPDIEPGWWLLGTAATGLAGLSHVGTGMVAIPACLAAAGLGLLKYRRDGWRSLRRALIPLSVVIVGVGVYWLRVLLPANGDYLTNPASDAYRGPDKLLSLLFSYWPTTVVVVGGGAATVVGLIGGALRRKPGGYPVLLTWWAFSWGAFVSSALTGAATDYPRFATLLLAPLAVAAGQAAVWLIGTFRSSLEDARGRRTAGALLPVGLVLVLGVMVPLSIDRHARQSAIYQPRAAASLTDAASWIDAHLTDPSAAVLTDVARDGKWVEGLTGRASLFSQPVRYAFRPVEWQRSLAADALLRSTDGVTSGYVTAQYTGLVTRGSAAQPVDLLISANHGGEFVDLLRIPAASTMVVKGGAEQPLTALAPGRVAFGDDADSASIVTVWTAGSKRRTAFTQEVKAWRDGSALAVDEHAPGHHVSTRLQPVPGMAVTSLTVTGADATACFTIVGDAAPCVRIHVAEADAIIGPTADGAIQVTTTRSHRLNLLVTALTAGDASVGLQLLRPRQLAADFDVKAALLYEPDPAYRERAARLTAIGFAEVQAFGPYRVLMRTGGSSG